MTSGLPISVVVPLYNKERYVERTIRSILIQDWADFELIVVDDGSTDGGAERVESFTDPRLRLVRQNNAGVSAARNRGIAEARGEIVAFLDADDEWENGFLTAIAELARQFPEAGLFATGFRTRYPSFAVESSANHPAGGTENSFLLPRYFHLASIYLFVTSSSVAVRKSVFSEVGGFLEGEAAGEDRDMWSRIALKYPLAYRRDILATYHFEAACRSCVEKSLGTRLGPDIRHLISKMGKSDLAEPQRRDIARYLNRRILQTISEIILDGDVARSRQIFQELRPYLLPGAKVIWYRYAAPILPTAALRLVEKISYSKLLFTFSARRRRAFFDFRFVPCRQPKT